MVHPSVAPSPVRAGRIVLFLAPIVILAGVTGCSHRRSAMRPVYGTPAPVVTSPGCTTPGCATPSSIPGSTIRSEPDTSEPFLTPAGGGSPSSVGSNPVTRANISPPVPASADEMEPPLNGAPARATPPSPVPSNLPELAPPNGAIKPTTGRMTGASRREPRLSLRDAVSPFLANPDDLFQPAKADRPWKYVVLHHSANATGGYDQIDRDHRKVLGFEGCGYHFVIGNGTDSPDGQIEVAERWLNQRNGVHCKNGKNPEVNEYGVGICLVGNFDQTAPTPRQVAAAKALVAYLASRYQVAPDHLGTHEQLANGPTACPGKNFPTDAILPPKHLAAR